MGIGCRVKDLRSRVQIEGFFRGINCKGLILNNISPSLGFRVALKVLWEDYFGIPQVCKGNVG